MSKKMLLAARYYSIEPLGIMYLAGTVRSIPGWECKVVLVKESDFQSLYEAVRDWNPDIVGIQVWTGYHGPAFAACDHVRALGVPVLIGGPHATYYHEDCAKHADWVIKGGGFGLFRRLLEGTLPKGVHFDKAGREDPFPQPAREVVYREYPELGSSPIKSIFASVGCPFFCTYCYAASFNQMHGGFKLTVRLVDDVIAEAQAILSRWPLKMVYFQDDIFGYSIPWLEEFTEKWRTQVGIPFHCQIRLELVNQASGDRRLDLFKRAGCSGITLAIESGDEFLRDQVLFRHMHGNIIEEGCRKILARGMTLRTEQILAVPFSDVTTDLGTLGLNNRINPTMAWTSILAPYGGTDMGTIATNFGFYGGNNDDLAETFFDRSVLHHVDGGPRDIKRVISRFQFGPKSRALLQMRVAKRDGDNRATIIHQEKGVVGELTFLDEAANSQYCSNTVRLQRHFMWLAKVPEAELLGKKLLAVPAPDWSWKHMGKVTEEHLRHVGTQPDRFDQWKKELASQMGLSGTKQLPRLVSDNPCYFVFFPEAATLIDSLIRQKVFEEDSFTETEKRLGSIMRRHLFHYGLYQIEKARSPIADVL